MSRVGDFLLGVREVWRKGWYGECHEQSLSVWDDEDGDTPPEVRIVHAKRCTCVPVTVIDAATWEPDGFGGIRGQITASHIELRPRAQ